MTVRLPSETAPWRTEDRVRAAWTAVRWGGPVVVCVALLAAWQLTIVGFGIEPYLLPRPGDVARAFADQGAVLWNGTVTTGVEILVSFAVSVVLGVACGVLTTRSRGFRRSVYPFLVATQAMPVLAAAPLFVVWFGYGLLPKVVLATLISFFPIVLGTIVGLQSTSPDEIRLARSLGLGRVALFWKIEIPNALPSIFGGLKIATALSVVGAVVAEFVGSSAGLGYIVLRATGRIDTALLFASIVIMVVLGVAFFALVSLVQSALFPWSTSRT